MTVTGLWKIIHDKKLLTDASLPANQDIHLDFMGSFFRVLMRGLDLDKSLYYISNLLKDLKHQLTIYIDGKHSLEKSETHKKRKYKRSRCISRGLRLLNCTRISAGRLKKIKSLLKGAFTLEYEEKELIAEFFSNQGFNVVLSEGEADIAIHRLPGKDNHIISHDCDYLLMDNVS